MQTFHHIDALRQSLTEQRRKGLRISLVPTMGNLHAGHISLVREARRYGDIVVTSIFVNPLQFGENEDLAAYPRTLQQDSGKLQEADCQTLFAPSANEMYPEGLEAHSSITVPIVSENHCGASRPGHFAGVATVVAKLLNIVQPDAALFGLKDYQQYQVIRKMVRDLCMPIEIVGLPTVREESGLALSSRNGYLTAGERDQAALLSRCLHRVTEEISRGREDFRTMEQEAVEWLRQQGFVPDYFNISSASTLRPAEKSDSDIVVLAAAWLGKTRLIDNRRIERQT